MNFNEDRCAEERVQCTEVDNSSEIGANTVAYDLNGNRVEGWQNRKGVYIKSLDYTKEIKGHYVCGDLLLFFQRPLKKGTRSK